MEDKKYCVYMHINKINNKKYIGMTSRKPNIRFGKNGKNYYNAKHFFNAINKYGWENFEHIILFKNLTKEEAEQKEIELISKYYTTDKYFGYNISKGGTGGNNKDVFPIKKYDLYGNYICTYDNATKAALDINGNRSCITHCCKSEKSRYKYKNFMWCYGNEEIIKPYIRSTWKPIFQYTLDKKYIKEFKNIAEAAKEVNGDISAISRCANHKQKYAYGYLWEWRII